MWGTCNLWLLINHVINKRRKYVQDRRNYFKDNITVIQGVSEKEDLLKGDNGGGKMKNKNKWNKECPVNIVLKMYI